MCGILPKFKNCGVRIYFFFSKIPLIKVLLTLCSNTRCPLPRGRAVDASSILPPTDWLEGGQISLLISSWAALLCCFFPKGVQLWLQCMDDTCRIQICDREEGSRQGQPFLHKSLSTIPMSRVFGRAQIPPDAFLHPRKGLKVSQNHCKAM